MLLFGFSRDKVSLVATVFFSSSYSFCHDRSFFGSLIICLVRSVVLSVLCRDNLMCGYWNSYIATSTIVSRQCFCAAFSNWCLDPVCYVATTCLFGSCCNFILILRHSLLMVSMFAVVTQILCCDRAFLYSVYICVTTQFVMSR